MLARTALSLCLISLLVPLVQAQPLTQTLPMGFGSGTGGGGSSWPFNATADHTWQWHYDSGQFVAPGPIIITEVYIRPLNSAAPTPFNYGSVELLMASSPTDYSVAGNGVQPGHDPVFANNLNMDATVVRTAAAWIDSPPAGVWIPMGMTAPFTYDPTVGDDFVLQIRKCGTVTTWGQSIFGTPCCPTGQGGNRYGNLGDCAATSQTSQNNEYVPVILIDYIPGVSMGTEYQLNQAGAGLDVNGVPGSPSMAASVIIPLGVTGFLNLSSANLGQPWELGVGIAPLVPRSAGGTATVDGQVLNLDIADPALALMWNFFASPGFVNFSGAISATVPATAGIQMVVFDPAQISGISISQPSVIMFL